MSRTLSVHKEHEFLAKLESAGLGDDEAQFVITFRGNELGQRIVREIRKEMLADKLALEGRRSGYNFTERLRKILNMAREESAKLDHEYVGTEHILLGFLREQEGVGSDIFRSLGFDWADVKVALMTNLKRGKSGPTESDRIPYTSRARKIIELAMHEARLLEHTYVGSEHILLGIIAEEKGIAAQVLIQESHRDPTVLLELARDEVRRRLGTKPA